MKSRKNICQMCQMCQKCQMFPRNYKRNPVELNPKSRGIKSEIPRN